ncbi:MAG: ribosome maturation factor RimM [bacterium]|nr:ribosome maturation factor RimM [bacterium]
MEDFFQVGIITSTHGLKGEVKVFPTTDDPKRFKKLKEVLVDTGKERISLEVEGAKFFKQFVILKLKGIDAIETAEKYRKASLFVPRKNAVRLNRDEYFVSDLMGLRVRDEDGGEIGVLRDVMETGANDVYVIDLDDGRELLLPAIKQCVLEVDVEAGFIRIHILEGLLEDQGL